MGEQALRLPIGMGLDSQLLFRFFLGVAKCFEQCLATYARFVCGVLEG
jgi:hypothetical protein